MNQKKNHETCLCRHSNMVHDTKQIVANREHTPQHATLKTEKPFFSMKHGMQPESRLHFTTVGFEQCSKFRRRLEKCLKLKQNKPPHAIECICDSL